MSETCISDYYLRHLFKAFAKQGCDKQQATQILRRFEVRHEPRPSEPVWFTFWPIWHICTDGWDVREHERSYKRTVSTLLEQTRIESLARDLETGVQDPEVAEEYLSTPAEPQPTSAEPQSAAAAKPLFTPAELQPTAPATHTRPVTAAVSDDVTQALQFVKDSVAQVLPQQQPHLAEQLVKDLEGTARSRLETLQQGGLPKDAFGLLTCPTPYLNYKVLSWYFQLSPDTVPGPMALYQAYFVQQRTEEHADLRKKLRLLLHPDKHPSHRQDWAKQAFQHFNQQNPTDAFAPCPFTLTSPEMLLLCMLDTLLSRAVELIKQQHQRSVQPEQMARHIEVLSQAVKSHSLSNSLKRKCEEAESEQKRLKQENGRLRKQNGELQKKIVAALGSLA